MQARDRADEIELLSRELMALAIKVQESESVLPDEKPPIIKNRKTPGGAKKDARPTLAGPRVKRIFGKTEKLFQSPPGPPDRTVQRVRATRIRGLYKSKVARLRELAPDLAGEFSKQLKDDK
jgi:hypothetical protein